MYVMNEEGFLIKFGEQEKTGDKTSVTATAEIVTDLGMGRPLGGAFDSDNNLYMADAHLGLTRLKNPGSGSKVELIASRVQLENGEWSQILYANDVAIGPKTGHVYFTDSTEIAPDRIGTRSWDTMFAAKTDLIRGSKSGRLLKYDPSTDTVSVLASGFRDLALSCIDCRPVRCIAPVAIVILRNLVLPACSHLNGIDVHDRHDGKICV